LCPVCKKSSNDGFIVDSEDNIRRYIRIKPDECVKSPTCKKCLKEIESKYCIKCTKCDIYYHGYCLKNYTNEMKNCIFFCPRCLLTDFAEEGNKYLCDLCNEYKTKIKQNLERHRLKCMKFKCSHCNKNFKNKILLKAHLKEIKKLENTYLLLKFVNNDEKKKLEERLNKMDIEDHGNKNKLQNGDEHNEGKETAKKIKTNDRSYENKTNNAKIWIP
jgi:hypothetical protein